MAPASLLPSRRLASSCTNTRSERLAAVKVEPGATNRPPSLRETADLSAFRSRPSWRRQFGRVERDGRPGRASCSSLRCNLDLIWSSPDARVNDTTILNR
ncbi:hypothetical protein MTP99_010117 [Tenebrio molitor]|uniref:Uncharacterized protein n=1 Tax=Tenebrio molitor TaxID=7067 RepID=A0A8J6LF77_TENMO|nr:hypothetical protein GEV33_005029 [Tenebrio molitor]KAJ3633150.1 hypothetical protein MTP99_010117 [Tenebrio molitor]